MHVGNVTAMLAAWLDARSRGDRLFLRLEDIDVPRVMAGADRLIMDDLRWLGLDWDGAPVRQSERLDLYSSALHALAGRRRDDGTPLVYPCFCSRADIRAASAPQEGDGFQVYPGTCRRLVRERPDEVRRRVERGDRHSLRLAMPDGVESFRDRVFGPCSYGLATQVGDPVIRRSDGIFSYQLVVVVDDLTMGVGSIVRGRDLLRSTALQQVLRRDLLAAGFASDAVAEARQPMTAHLPLVDNAAGRRLAKRERSLDMGALRSRGVTAAEVVGCAARLLRLRPDCRSVTPQDLLDGFSWEPLRRDHADSALVPGAPGVPDWAVGPGTGQGGR